MDYFSIYNRLKDGTVRLIDLRSSGEFQNGAMPFAVNIPLFDDNERAMVGTAYKSEGRLTAIQIGLELVAAKIPTLLNKLLEQVNPSSELFVHCWRGGMRSGSIAKLLRTVGIRAETLPGGYKSYRQQVLGFIEKLAQHPLLVLNGRTGSGKTDLLREIQKTGKPIIDFEGIAKHRGSAFGDMQIHDAQPTQQNFENVLANAYFEIQHEKKILVEIEQSLGTIQMPHHLRTHVYDSPIVLLERPFEQRVERLVKEYASSWNSDVREYFLRRLELLRRHLTKEIFSSIQEAISSNDLHTAARLMLLHRYDHLYDKSINRRKLQTIAQFDLNLNHAEAVRFLMAEL